MVRIIPLICLTLLTASCARYQYTTVSSAGTPTNDKLEFVTENDSLRIVYNFSGINAPVRISIQNKLAVPLYIDWQRSALIVNDKTISYTPSEMQIKGGFHGSSYNYGSRGSGFSSSSGSIHATAALPATTDFIPPHSFLEKNPMAVTNKFIYVADSAFHKKKLNTWDGYAITVKHATFTEANSPLRFRSYLTLIVGEPTAKPAALEHNFYVSELINSNTAPTSMIPAGTIQGNRYYLKEQTGYGKTMTGFGVIAGTALLLGTAEAAGQAAGNAIVR